MSVEAPAPAAGHAWSGHRTAEVMLQINQTLSSRRQAPSRRSARAPTTGGPRSSAGYR